MRDQYQTVTLVLADGREVTYTGRAQMEHDKPHRVVEVRFSPANELPAGMSFDTIYPRAETRDEKEQAALDAMLYCPCPATSAGNVGGVHSGDTQ